MINYLWLLLYSTLDTKIIHVKYIDLSFTEIDFSLIYDLSIINIQESTLTEHKSDPTASPLTPISSSSSPLAPCQLVQNLTRHLWLRHSQRHLWRRNPQCHPSDHINLIKRHLHPYILLSLNSAVTESSANKNLLWHPTRKESRGGLPFEGRLRVSAQRHIQHPARCQQSIAPTQIAPIQLLIYQRH